MSTISQKWLYTPDMADNLKFKFKGSNKITQNYSQAFQDLFVLSMLDGKKNGIFLEIGAHKPIDNNNTFLLENIFGWSGVSIDIDPMHIDDWKVARPSSNLVIADALRLDYNEILHSLCENKSHKNNLRHLIESFFKSESTNNRIDYLQIDIDPSINTLKVLNRIPLDRFRFSVITFETDVYARDFRAQAESRSLLLGHGYELVAPDVSVLYEPISNSPIPFEDWWVDPAVIGRDKIKLLTSMPWIKSNPRELLLI
jgi:hypothetical protein